MTTLFNSLKECGCCGNTISVTAVGSTNAFGSPDLDLRPPEMKRSALLMSIQYCGHCGYAAWDLEESITQTDELKQLLSEDLDKNDKSQIFERAAQIARINGSDGMDTFFLYLCAAWCADDKGDTQRAVLMRKKSLEASHWTAVRKPEKLLRLIDVARRAGEFETACRLLERFDRCKVSEPLLKQIACFQKQLLDNEDVSCYTVQEAISGSRS